MYQEKAYNSSMYCLKSLGAFFVICLHTFGPWVIRPVIGIAVPLFFMISGYFLYRENESDALYKCKKSLKKIFWLTLYANIFYFICLGIPNDYLPFKSLRSIIDFIIFGETFSYHLWYLNAYIETLLIVILCLKFKIINKLWLFIPLILILGLALGKYRFLFPFIPPELCNYKNFILYGIPCFGVGWLLSKYNKRILKYVPSPILLSVIILILAEIEIIALKYTDNLNSSVLYLIGTLPLAASLVLVAIKYPFLGKKSFFEKVGKNYSTFIYVFHIFIIEVVYFIFDTINKSIPTLKSLSIFIPLIVYFLTIFFTAIWRKSSKEIF